MKEISKKESSIAERIQGTLAGAALGVPLVILDNNTSELLERGISEAYNFFATQPIEPQNVHYALGAALGAVAGYLFPKLAKSAAGLAYRGARKTAEVILPATYKTAKALTPKLRKVGKYGIRTAGLAVNDAYETVRKSRSGNNGDETRGYNLGRSEEETHSLPTQAQVTKRSNSKLEKITEDSHSSDEEEGSLL